MHAASVRPACGGARPARKLRVTQRRIDANRRNAMRSTGPRTREGKARVRLNAIRHGLRARDDIYLSYAGADAADEIAELFLVVCEGFHPAGITQRSLAYKMAHALWKERLAFELGERERYWEAASRPPAERDRLWRLIGALTSYETRAAREFDHAFGELFKLQHPSKREIQRTNPLDWIFRASGGRSEGPRPRRESPAEAGGSAETDRDEIQRTKPLARGIHQRFTGDSAQHPHPSVTIAAKNDRSNRAGHLLP